MKIMTVIGTRPEGIKMAPVIKLLAQDPALKSVVVTTGQHREMLQTVFEVFDFKTDYDLKIMAPNQTLTQITSRVLLGMERVLQQEKPDLILVHGDTSTTMAASLSAFYHQIPIGHVEAGLRTWDKYSPYPEEMNRQLTDDLADLYFAPTKLSQANLLKEHHRASRIFVTGNTAIDALQYMWNRPTCVTGRSVPDRASPVRLHGRAGGAPIRPDTVWRSGRCAGRW